MASIVSGLLFVATGAESKQGVTPVLESAANARVAGIPVIFAVFMCCLLAVWFLLTRTKYGHYIYSVGGNAEASHLSGVPVQRVQIFAFAMGGLMAAGAGLLLLGQTMVGQPSAAADWPLEAIAICVVGGIALTGGVGRIEDVLAATLLLGVISNGLNQLNVSPYWKPTVTGLVILMAVVIDRYSQAPQRRWAAARQQELPDLCRARRAHHHPTDPVGFDLTADWYVRCAAHALRTRTNPHPTKSSADFRTTRPKGAPCPHPSPPAAPSDVAWPPRLPSCR